MLIRSVLTLLFLASLLAAPLFAGDTPPETPSLAELRKGDVVFHTKLGAKRSKKSHEGTTASILIDAPAEKVWHFINRGSNAPEYTAGLVRADVLDRGEDYSVVEQEIKVRLIPGSFVYTIKNHLTEKFRRIDFERQSGDLKEIKGYWRLEPLDSGERTTLTYSLNVSTGYPLPKALMEASARTSIHDVLEKLRTKVSREE